MTDVSMKNWVVVDPLLSAGVDGHPQTMVRALLRAGIIAEAFGNSDCEDIYTKKIFESSGRKINFLGKCDGAWDRFCFRCAWIFWILKENLQCFQGIWKIRKDQRNWIFLNAQPRFILAMLLFAIVKRKQKHEFWFFDSSSRFYCIPGFFLKVLRPRNIAFHAETPGMSAKYANVLCFSCQYAPFPMELRPLLDLENIPLRIGVLGLGRKEKGYDLLPSVVRFVQDMKKNEPIEFHIQDAPVWESEMISICKGLSRLPIVRRYEACLEPQAYDSLLDSVHVVFIPYRLASYRVRSSWIAMEAIAAGKVVLMTRGISACELVEMHGEGLFFEDGDVPGMVECIRRVLEDKNIVQRAHDKARIFRDNGFWTPSQN